MELIQKILECDEKELDTIVQQAIEEANANATKVGRLGFLDYGKLSPPFKGFIPLDTRIKYSSFLIEDYSMQTTDFMLEFAHYIRKRPYIKTKKALVYYTKRFITSYFGTHGDKSREQIFNEDIWSTSKTDEEYFAALENNKIGDLKHTGAAECTEIGAVAQQILSLFGTECYYCIGCIKMPNIEDAHCFNIVKRKNDYALVDYSCAVQVFNNKCEEVEDFPFIGIMSNEEFQEFIKGGKVKAFEEYVTVGNERVPLKSPRLYVVESTKIDKTKIQTSIDLARQVTPEIGDVKSVDEAEQNISIQEKRLQSSRNEDTPVL